MIVTLEKTKAWLRVESTDEDALIESYITAAEDIVTSILRFPLTEYETVPEPIVQAVLYCVSVFFEKRNEADMVGMLGTLKSFLFAYRKEAW